MEIMPQKITLDINSDTCYQLLVVKQWDKGSRYIEITLTADGSKLELSKISSSILFSASLNGVLVQNDRFKANENNDTVTVKLSDNALSASGRLECEITAIKEDDKVTSATFYVKVAASAKGKAGAILDLLEGIVDNRMLKNDSVTGSKIANGAVGSSQLADRAINRPELFDPFFLETYLSMPMRSISVPGTIQKDTYDEYTDTGVYNVGTRDGKREMLVVYKLSEAHVVQVRYLTDKILFRGIHAEIEGKFTADEWSEWEEITNKMPSADTLKLISSLGEDADPELIAYQTSDPTTPSTIRIPLSLIKGLLGTAGTQDFVNAGEFDAFDKINKYHFQYDKIYRVNITADIYGNNNTQLPKGVYFGRLYYSEQADDILVFTPFEPNGKFYSLVHGSLSNVVYLSNTADQTFDPESENAQSGIAVAKAKDFINLGEFHDIKRLDWALGKNGYDTSKVYRFSFRDDIFVNDSVIPGGTAYIGHVTNSEKRGFAMEFEPIISDGVKRIIVLETVIPNVYDYLELASFVNDGTGADSSDPNRHAKFFAITDDGELSLKPEYTAIGELNAELPADLVIPEVVNEIVVDRLSSKMFLENKVIESVTFPDTINDIPDECFNMAVNLRELKNTEHIKRIGAKAFRWSRIEKAVFPNLEEITGTLAFSTIPHLAYADVGKVTDIPAQTFKHCIYLSKVVGSNVTTVGKEAFNNTVRLVNVDFLNQLTSIGDFAFWQTKFKYDWKSLSNCNFSEKSTTAQIYPEDFWSDIDFTTCVNPTPTALGQRDPRWSDVQYGVDENPSGHIQTYHVGCLQMSIMHAYSGLTGRKFETVFEFENIIKALTKANEKVVIFKRNGNSVEFDNYLVAQNGTMAHAIPMAEAAGLATTYYEKSDWNSDRLRAIYETLANGGYVVLNIDEPDEHAILIYGVSDKGELLVLDSALHFPYDGSIPSRYKLPFNTLVYPTSDMLALTLSNISASVFDVDTTTTAGKIIFYYKSEVPENVEFVKVGILGVDKSNYNEATFHVGTSDSNVYDRNPPSDGTGKPNTPYSWTKSNVTSGQTWIAKAYVQYRTLYGSIVTIYSDTIEITRE